MYGFGTLALAFLMGGLPTIALAESGGIGVDVNAGVRVQTQVIDASARVGESEDRQEMSGKRENKSEVQNSNEQKDDEELKNEDQEDQGEIEIELEDDEDIAFSLDDLKKKIETRKLELDDEEASTTVKSREIVKNANEVRLAVHSLLASKELLGGIGWQVSEIAKDMNDSVATTTNAEVRIQARSFFAKLFFGGDSAAAEVITQSVAQNQQRINDLTKLLGEANVSADIQIVLKAQIAAIQDAQTRLHALAEKEQKMWGLFSWRF